MKFTEEQRKAGIVKARLKWGRKKRKNLKAFLDELVGRKCYFCGFEHRRIVHTKSGVEHKDFASMTKEELLEVESHKDDYVCLCFMCHKAVHWCMKHLKLTWKEIEGLVV